MKKTLLIVSLLAAVVVGGNAQTKDARLGLKVGPSFDWASSGSTDVNNFGARLGFEMGLVAEYPISNLISVSSGVDFNLLRMRYEFMDHRNVNDFIEKVDVSVMRKAKVGNIEIPFKLKVGWGFLDAFKAYVEAGAGLGINIKDMGKDSYTFNWITYEDNSYVDCTNQYRMFQGSLILGLGAEYEINRNLSVFAQLKFDHAFSNAFNRTFASNTGSVLHNNFIGIEVGVLH